MKTYYMKEMYDNDTRITVEDDTQVSINSYDGDREGALVKFSKPTTSFNEELIAAFSRVNRVYLEGTLIEEQTREYGKSTEAIAKEVYTTEWKPVSVSD